MTIEIHLTKGYVATVDDCDAHLAGFNWHYGNGYAKRSLRRINGYRPRVFLHHAILGYPLKGLKVDHKNGSTMDCRRENLRLATIRENNLNTKKQRGEKPKSSRFVGVHLAQHRDKRVKGNKLYSSWMAKIEINGKQCYLGRFKTEEEAARAYQDALARI